MENPSFVIAGLMVLALIFLMALFAKLFRKAGPHEAIIVYGFRGTRVVKGRGTVIFPMVENCRGLSLELMSFDVAPKQDLYTRQGVAVTVARPLVSVVPPVVDPGAEPDPAQTLLMYDDGAHGDGAAAVRQRRTQCQPPFRMGKT